jgi:hypothetical protein
MGNEREAVRREAGKEVRMVPSFVIFNFALFIFNFSLPFPLFNPKFRIQNPKFPLPRFTAA